MRKWCEVVFYSGDGPFPAYYLIDTIEGEALNAVLKEKLVSVTQRVRKMFDIRQDVPDSKIYEALYALREEGLVSITSMT